MLWGQVDCAEWEGTYLHLDICKPDRAFRVKEGYISIPFQWPHWHTSHLNVWLAPWVVCHPNSWSLALFSFDREFVLYTYCVKALHFCFYRKEEHMWQCKKSRGVLGPQEPMPSTSMWGKTRAARAVSSLPGPPGRSDITGWKSTSY